MDLLQSAKPDNDSASTKDFKIVDGKLLAYLGNEENVIIPDGIKSIEDGAFENNNTVTCVTIPKTVKKIGKDAFSRCNSLKKVVFSEGLTTIGNGSFSYCKELEEVCLPESISKIGNKAFALCKKISKVTIGDKVKSVGKYAFNACPLKEIHIKGDDTTFDECSLGENASANIFVYSDTISLNQIGAYLYSTFYCHRGNKIEQDLNERNESLKDNPYLPQCKIEYF